MNDPKIAFEMTSIKLLLSDILPIRVLKDPKHDVKRYETILCSIREVGLVEPLMVARQPGVEGKYTLVDGHLRLYALTELGITEAECLVAMEDESYTYNARVSRLAPIQEHKMIVKAVKDGLSPERIASALNLSVRAIDANMKLLDGIHEEAIELLKEKQISPGTLKVLKKVTAVRQIEMAELMVSTNTFTKNYAEALLMGTPKSQLREPETPKAAPGMTAEEVARMEQEMESLHTDFKAVEASYGENMLNLTVARGYIKKLFENAKVARFLKARHQDLCAEFEVLATTELL